MSCENPLLIENPRYKKMSTAEYVAYCNTYFGGETAFDKWLEVPCGHCHSCEVSRMRNYMIRLLYELDAHPDSLFITLTFDDDSLDKFRDNPNKAVRLFLDRVRKAYGKQVRHWIVPEFGTLRGRIHYHGILFGVGNTFIGYNLPNLWKYGYTYVGWANSRTARYITKYVTKSLNRSYDKTLPRIITSKGIGLSYLNDYNISFHSSDGVLRPYIPFNGLKVSLPRYYSIKLFSDEDRYQMLIERFLNPENKFYVGSEFYTDIISARAARKRLFSYNCELNLSFLPNIKTDKLKNIIYGINSDSKEF